MSVFIRLRQLLRRGRGQEGAAAVEFAIILRHIDGLTLAGFFDFGWLFYWQHSVTTPLGQGLVMPVQAKLCSVESLLLILMPKYELMVQLITACRFWRLRWTERVVLPGTPRSRHGY